MKVFITTRAIYPFHGYGGMGLFYYNLAKHLAEQDIDVEVITASPTIKENRILNKILRSNSMNMNMIKFTFIPYIRRPVLIWNYIYNFYVKKYLVKSMFDILHSSGAVGSFPYIYYKKRNPIIAQCIGLEMFRNPANHLDKVYGWLFAYYPSKAVFNNAEIVAVEGPIQAKEVCMIFGVSRSRIRIIPNGVDIDLIKEYTSKCNLSREDLNVHDADIVLINVGRLDKHKGIPYLISALRLLNSMLNVKLILIGSGVEKRKIYGLIRKYNLENKVIHFENISDRRKFELYKIADIFVMPTLYEGLPTVVLEAMAVGLPIVASNVSEIPTVVRNGINGFLVPPANPKAIATSILKIYDKNLIHIMGRLSRELVRKYDWKLIAKEAIRIYESVLR